MSFNIHLKEELEYKGMLVKELAHKTGIPKQTIDKYLLNSACMPPADKAVLIAGALGVSVEYLVTGKKTTVNKTPVSGLSSETRKIADCIEPLSKEKRKIIKDAVIELSKLLEQTEEKFPVTLSPLQKVFLRIFK